MRRRGGESSRREFLAAMAGGAVGLGFDGRVFAAEPIAGGQAEMTFGAVADAQYADADTRGTRQYRLSIDKLAEAVKRLSGRGLDFAIHLGDFIDRDFTSFAKVGPVYARLKAPRYHVLGNHDWAVAAADKSRVLGALGLDKLGPKKGYYDYSVGRWRLIVLNGTDVSTYANAAGGEPHREAREAIRKLKARKAANATDWNGGIGKVQLAWLSGRLDAAAKARQRVLIFCHMPAFPANAHNLYNDAVVLKLIDAHESVVAYINGHNHAGNYARRKGVHFLTLKGMVEGDTNAFAVIEAHRDHLKVTGFGREASRRLTSGGGEGGGV
jgi:manganese-dependent ADP-ribose/CDP-alcohol diphosphatase